MKQNKKYQNQFVNYSLAKACLDIFLGVGESIGRNNKNAWRKALGAPNLPNWRINKAFAYLERLNYLEKIHNENDAFYKLTKDGRIKGLLNRMRRGIKANQKGWDGKWRLVIWDIPEEYRMQRNHLRKWVKDMGFSRLQMSIFITPFPIPSEAIEYLNETDLSKFIRFLRVDKIDNDSDLRKIFGL